MQRIMCAYKEGAYTTIDTRTYITVGKVYDVYAVGLTLVRVLFRPLWDAPQFNAFMVSILNLCVYVFNTYM